MANPKHLAILKQSVEVWNEWREANPDTTPDLRKADLGGLDLSEVDLRMAYLTEADLRETVLIAADFSRVNLIKADLRKSDLRNTRFSDALLRSANMSGAILSYSDLSRANLTTTDLSSANLRWANLSAALLYQTELSNAICGATLFADLDLSYARGLDTIQHLESSKISIDVIFRSQEKLSDRFLRGCGVPENLIMSLDSLIKNAPPFHPCFITYSPEFRPFAQWLHDRLQNEGVRCWLDEHQLNSDDPKRPSIYKGIREGDKVLLCCTESALKSWWLEGEFHRAMDKEKEYHDNILISLDLDGYLFSDEHSNRKADEIRSRVVADFKGWENDDTVFERELEQVVWALRTDLWKPAPLDPLLKWKQ